MTYFNNIYAGRRILVTGNTGFKGSWLSLWLHHLGAKVAGFSNSIPTSPSNFDLLNLKKDTSHYQGDIRDKVRLSEVIDDFKPEIIFHLAAQAIVSESYADPRGTFETNIMGMVNLLDCIRSRDWIEAAILITSDKAYRNDEWCWGYRESDALGGYDPYSGSKSCADLVAQSYFHSFFQGSNTRVAITRAGNVIGGGDWAVNRIVPDSIRAWSNNESVNVRKPNATRPWQHVLEPLSGYLWLGAHLLKKSNGVNGEAFNFGPDAHVNQTVAELLDAMSKRWPRAKWKSLEVNKIEGHEATLLKLSYDKALFFLNWKAVLEFHETVIFTVDWYRVFHEKNENIQKFSLNQINEYCKLANKRELLWAQN
jgi:CDP-glucose 4,6-dehydratase